MSVINEYGPTETVVGCAVYRCRAADVPDEAVPIGRPITNTRLYILDPHLELTPVGVPGELHIGGAGLARGYLNRPELTAEKFIPNPFSQTPGERLYKTGDLVRYRPDGNLEFLGRLDHQVKIRGFRIELGEIEAALAALPVVREAVVLARGEGAERQLVAYVVAHEPAEGTGCLPPNVSELRSALKASLPDYMVPAAWVFLPALPLTPNGKVDRKALPEPDRQAGMSEGGAPRDAFEEIVAGLWSTVLRQPNLGIHDNFFELGGHSLLATQLTSRLRDALGVSVPLRWIFEAPSVAELAERLRPAVAGEVDAGEASIRHIAPAPRDRPLPLSFAQQRLWFLDQLEGPSATYNLPSALDLRGSLDEVALRSALAEIVRRHEALRTCLITQEGEPLQLITAVVPASSFPLSRIDLRSSANPNAEAQRLAQAEALKPFDLAREIPLRATLIQREAQAWTLLLTLHHSAADGWSMAILVREFVALYGAFREGRASPLPELAIQYADFALWQRDYLSGARLQQHLEIWRNRLAGAPECLNLPTDRPRPARQSYRGGAVEFWVEAGLTSELKELSRGSGATLFMTLFSAWAGLLGRYSGEEDLVIGSPVANRTQSAIEPLIGFFVNTLALRADLSGEPSFRQVLSRVRQVCLEAYAHQELPFESLVESLGVARNLSHAPLFQVMFVLQNNPEESLVLPGLDLMLREGESTVTKFDLTLSVSEVAGRLHASLEYADRPLRRRNDRTAGETFQGTAALHRCPAGAAPGGAEYFVLRGAAATAGGVERDGRRSGAWVRARVI